MKIPKGMHHTTSWGVADSDGRLLNALPLPSRAAARATRAAMGNLRLRVRVVRVLTITIIKDAS